MSDTWVCPYGQVPCPIDGWKAENESLRTQLAEARKRIEELKEQWIED